MHLTYLDNTPWGSCSTKIHNLKELHDDLQVWNWYLEFSKLFPPLYLALLGSQTCLYIGKQIKFAKDS